MSEPDQASLDASFEHCREVARARAGNFYYGMKLTPEPKRSAIYAVYAFMRACDDLADEADARAGADAARAEIDAFRGELDRVLAGERIDGAFWPAFAHVLNTYPIDPADLHHMLDGQAADMTVHRYATFDDLYRYCYNVASTVGLVCISVWGHEEGGDSGDETRTLAEQRGIALQLTNILRDLAEDAGAGSGGGGRGRVYLPAEDFERFGYTEADLQAGTVNAAFDEFMAFQIERARSYYAMSEPLERRLTPDCRATSWAMMRIYRGLLDRIAEAPRRVLRERIRLSKPAKVGIAARAAWKRSWS